MTTDDSAATQPAPKPPSAFWKWVRRIGCALVLMMFTCCGLTCGGFWWYDHSVQVEVDRFHAEGLKGGDVKAMHDHADPEFRKKHSVDELQDWLNARPGILEHKNFRTQGFSQRTIDGVEYVKLKSRRTMFGREEYEIVCKVVNGLYVFVGISPGMDEFVPPRFKFGSGSSRRHRWD